METYRLLIKDQYENSRSDSSGLFEVLVAVAGDIGMEAALACLEQCVLEKRLAWIEKNHTGPAFSASPLQDGYRIFFERYLGLQAPEDGEVVEISTRRLVMHWWNECPTLAACTRLGLDTRQVCRLAYHRPVEALLRQVDPRLRFERNYDLIRPHAPYCEEIIWLDENSA